VTEGLGKEIEDAQKAMGEGVDELKKKAGELIDEATKKAKEGLDKAKQALTPETIKEIKEIDKAIKEAVPNLVGLLPGPAQQVVEKLDKLIEKLDPPEDDPEGADGHVVALGGLMEKQLKPLIDDIGARAKQEIALIMQRLELTYDLLLILDAEAGKLAEVVTLGSSTGACYSRRGCTGTLLHSNVTATYCWQHGGMSWKDSAGKCHPLR